MVFSSGRSTSQYSSRHNAIIGTVHDSIIVGAWIANPGSGFDLVEVDSITWVRMSVTFCVNPRLK